MSACRADCEDVSGGALVPAPHGVQIARMSQAGCLYRWANSSAVREDFDDVSTGALVSASQGAAARVLARDDDEDDDDDGDDNDDDD